MSDKTRFLHPYYLCNVFLCAAYVFLRIQRLSPKQLAAADMFGVTREFQIYLCVFLMLFSRLLSAPTLDAYLSSAFLFARPAILVCLWYMNERYMLIFIALWLLVFVAYPQPRYRLPSSIVTLNTPSFKQRIAENTHRTIYILWCHAPWSGRCSQLTPVLASLASKFDHPRIHFARIDVSRFSDVAETLNVSVAPTSKQLPCVIAFKQGKEQARLPTLDTAGNIPKLWTHGFTAAHIAQELDIHTLYKTAVEWETEAQRRYGKKDK